MLGFISNGKCHQRRKIHFPPLWMFVPTIIVILFVLLPLVYIILRAKQAGWHTAIELIFRPRVYELLRNTVLLTATVTLASMTIGLITAWCIERSNLPGRRIWNVILTLPFAVPAFVSSYSWVSLSPKLQGFGGAALILTLSSYPLVHLPVAASLRGMDPALEETARSLGYSQWRTFWRVILPQTRPALFGGALLIALHMLAEFGALSLLRFETFTTAIYDEYQLAFSNASAAMLAAVLLVLCLILLFFEVIVRGRARYARIGKGVARLRKRVPLGKTMPLVIVFFIMLALLAIGVPMAMLVYWLIIGSSRAFPIYELGTAIISSLGLAFGGALFTIIFAIPVAVLAVRYRGYLATLADRLPYMLRAVPGLVIALALVFFSVNYAYSLYQTTFLLLIGYALLYLPLALASIRAAAEQAPIRLEETARTLGKRPFQVFFSVTLPLILPGIGSGATLVFLEGMKELTATLLLRPTGINTLATEVWTHTSNTEYAAAAPFAALLVLVSGIPAYLLTRHRNKF
ncbi:iron(III) transport system permease protein [Scopulibacillus daqui]|uniref:Iron(III) transport system permease protein n=1 Tax=Scopulibacillus daqui TaxID=1469162 RepID=A0ABS2Q2Q7_9BACL|nr:iron ABC transporter permease [Scopulibacillus daqui]MBM7646125.1 iron(III) transport system permease protein [Scopulibacillus daqui]